MRSMPAANFAARVDQLAGTGKLGQRRNVAATTGKPAARYSKNFMGNIAAVYGLAGQGIVATSKPRR